MGLVDRLNQWVLRRGMGQTSPGVVTISPEHLRIVDGGGKETIVPWNSIQRIMAVTRDIYIRPDFQVMLIQWGPLNIVELNEDMQGWSDLGAAFDRYLPGATPSAQWLLELLSIPTGPVRIFHREPDLVA